MADSKMIRNQYAPERVNDYEEFVRYLVALERVLADSHMLVLALGYLTREQLDDCLDEVAIFILKWRTVRGETDLGSQAPTIQRKSVPRQRPTRSRRRSHRG